MTTPNNPLLDRLLDASQDRVSDAAELTDADLRALWMNAEAGEGESHSLNFARDVLAAAHAKRNSVAALNQLTAMTEAMGGYDADFAPAVPVAMPVVAWRASYLNAHGKGNFYTTCVYELAVENDDGGEPEPLVCQSVALAALAAKDAEIEALRKDAERLVWAMDRMGFGPTSQDFTRHVLQRGSTGDLSDCRTFIDEAIAASTPPKE